MTSSSRRLMASAPNRASICIRTDLRLWLSACAQLGLEFTGRIAADRGVVEHYLDISGDEVNSAVYTYMGILLTLRPPALGGEPEKAREYFEKAIALTDGKDLSAKVEYARGYANCLYERELHDQLA